MSFRSEVFQIEEKRQFGTLLIFVFANCASHQVMSEQFGHKCADVISLQSMCELIQSIISQSGYKIGQKRFR